MCGTPSLSSLSALMNEMCFSLTRGCIFTWSFPMSFILNFCFAISLHTKIYGHFGVLGALIFRWSICIQTGSQLLKFVVHFYRFTQPIVYWLVQLVEGFDDLNPQLFSNLSPPGEFSFIFEETPTPLVRIEKVL